MHKQTLDVIWIVYYLLITFVLLLILYPFHEIADKIRNRLSKKSSSEEDGKSINFLYNVFCLKPWQLLLIPGEDGFFFLPLLYIGITPVTAVITSGLFAAMHLNWASIQSCICKFIISFAIVWYVLPHGILPIVIGHLIVDSSGFALILVVKKRKKLVD